MKVELANTAIHYVAWHVARYRAVELDELLARSLRDFPIFLEDVSCRRKSLEIAADILALRGFIVVDQSASSKRYTATARLQVRRKSNRSMVKNTPVFAVAAMTAACSILPSVPPAVPEPDPPAFRRLTLIHEEVRPQPAHATLPNSQQRPRSWIRLGDSAVHHPETTQAGVPHKRSPNLLPVIRLGASDNRIVSVGQASSQTNQEAAGAPIRNKTPYIGGPNYFANPVSAVRPRFEAAQLSVAPAASITTLSVPDKPIEEPPKRSEQQLPPTPIETQSLEVMSEAPAKAILDEPPAAGKSTQHQSMSATAADMEAAAPQAPEHAYVERDQHEDHVTDASQLTETQQIERFLEQWAQDWRKKNVDATLAHYADSFKPENMSLPAWKNWRRIALARKGDIELSYDVRSIGVRGDRATVLIWQSYRSPYFKSRIGKELVLTKHNGAWLIHRETVKESAR